MNACEVVFTFRIFLAMLPTALGIWFDNWNVSGYLIELRAKVQDSKSYGLDLRQRATCWTTAPAAISVAQRPRVSCTSMLIFSQKILSLGLYELFRWVYVRCDDVNVSPGSSTSPPSDPGRETVFTD